MPNIFETLTVQREGARIMPWLASEFHAEEGGRLFRFRLREDVRFHDGRRLTARDVRYSLEHLFTNAVSRSRLLYTMMRGANALLQGQSKELEGFRILSAFEFTIELNQPVSFFPALLSFPAAAIIPEGSTPKFGSWREGSVGTGPFRVVRFEPGRRLELEANPGYWRPEYPKSDGLIFSFGVSPQEVLQGFRTGRFSVALDLLPSDVEALRHEPQFASRYGEVPTLSTYYAVFNIHRGPLSDEKTRQNLVKLIDVEGLVRRCLGRIAIPAHGLIPPGLPGYEPTPQANKRSSGERTLEHLELAVMLNSVYEGPFAALAKELFRTLQEKGIRIRIEGSSFERYDKTLASGTIDLALSRWQCDFPDSDSFIHGLLHTQAGILGSFCGTPEMDQLIERGRSETRPELRHEIYREAEELITRRALLLPLFHEQTYRFARPELEGFEVNLSLQSVPYEKLWIRR